MGTTVLYLSVTCVWLDDGSKLQTHSDRQIDFASRPLQYDASFKLSEYFHEASVKLREFVTNRKRCKGISADCNWGRNSLGVTCHFFPGNPSYLLEFFSKKKTSLKIRTATPFWIQNRINSSKCVLLKLYHRQLKINIWKIVYIIFSAGL